MNFFQVPNFLWDMDNLDVYERVVLTHIIRKTIGWGKSEDGISLSQFQKALGISKNTVIKALKKLIEKNILVKKTSFNENGSQSFNLYSLTDEIIKKANSSSSDEQGVFTRGTGGSSSDEQGVVHEMNTQNTSNTKDTNTKDTNTKDNIKKEKKEKKEKFTISSALKKSDIQTLMSDIQVKEDFLYELDNHRKSINKPIASIKALIATLKDIRDTSILTKRSANELLEIMEEQGWKSIKKVWLDNLEDGKVEKQTRTVKSNLSEAQRAIEMFGNMNKEAI